MTIVADQAVGISSAALDYLNGVMEVSFREWDEEFVAGLERYSGAVAEVTHAVETRLRALGRRHSEYAWGASIFAAHGAVIAEMASGLPRETRAGLRRPWELLLGR
ncbi:MAG: hypothetical protein REI11_18035 [Patulibacter sp.]|nr:hypothetical protein [Patulibacter sp.]